MANKDTIAGKVQEVGGAARKNLNNAIGNEEGAARGARDEVAGNVRKNFGKVKDALD